MGLTKDGCSFAVQMKTRANTFSGRQKKSLRNHRPVMLKTRFCRTFTIVYIELALC